MVLMPDGSSALGVCYSPSVKGPATSPAKSSPSRPSPTGRIALWKACLAPMSSRHHNAAGARGLTHVRRQLAFGDSPAARQHEARQMLAAGWQDLSPQGVQHDPAATRAQAAAEPDARTASLQRSGSLPPIPAVWDSARITCDQPQAPASRATLQPGHGPFPDFSESSEHHSSTECAASTLSTLTAREAGARSATQPSMTSTELEPIVQVITAECSTASHNQPGS
jgi:hypothetical protein